MPAALSSAVLRLLACAQSPSVVGSAAALTLFAAVGVVAVIASWRPAHDGH